MGSNVITTRSCCVGTLCLYKDDPLMHMLKEDMEPMKTSLFVVHLGKDGLDGEMQARFILFSLSPDLSVVHSIC